MSTSSDLDTSSRRRRNRSWPEALKREIVAASFAPGASVSRVARRYEVNANQVFAWRKRYGAVPAELRLVPVTVTADTSVGAPPSGSDDLIEVSLPAGYRLRLGSGFEAAALRRALDVLERRPVCRSLGEGR